MGGWKDYRGDGSLLTEEMIRCDVGPILVTETVE